MKQTLKKNKASCSSKFKGVHLNKKNGKWQARIRKDRKLFYLGSFKNEEDAARAYDKKAIELFGRFAMTNAMLGIL